MYVCWAVLVKFGILPGRLSRSNLNIRLQLDGNKMPLQIDLPWPCDCLWARRGFIYSICLSRLYTAIKPILIIFELFRMEVNIISLFPCLAVLAPELQNPRNLLLDLT